jgi:hypothetical protein
VTISIIKIDMFQVLIIAKLNLINMEIQQIIFYQSDLIYRLCVIFFISAII